MKSIVQKKENVSRFWAMLFRCDVLWDPETERGLLLMSLRIKCGPFLMMWRPADSGNDLVRERLTTAMSVW